MNSIFLLILIKIEFNNLVCLVNTMVDKNGNNALLLALSMYDKNSKQYNSLICLLIDSNDINYDDINYDDINYDDSYAMKIAYLNNDVYSLNKKMELVIFF